MNEWKLDLARHVKRYLRYQNSKKMTHSPIGNWQLATILSQQGDPNGAIEEYQAALKLNPSLSAAYRELGAV